MKTEKSVETPENIETIDNLDTSETTETDDLKENFPVKLVPELGNRGTEIEARCLTTDFNLTLHTAPSYAIFTGEWAPGKIGLMQFTQFVQVLWKAFEEEDPYAEWQLLKIYEAAQSLKIKMQKQEILLRKQIRSLRGIQVKPFRNAKPFNASLRSANILVLMAGSLIAQTDYLTRQILILKQMGIVPQGQVRPQLYSEEIQKVFAFSQQWQQTGITRQDILDKNERAKKVGEKFGQLPEDILYQITPLLFLNLEE